MSDTKRDTALAILGGNPDGGTAFSVAVRRQGRIAERFAPTAARVDLAELVRQALADAGAEPSDIAEVRVDRGPGSYIGLRVAVTFARCFAAFSGCRLLAADSLAAAACAALRADPGLAGRRIAVMLDGRQGRAQFATYRIDQHGRIEAEAPAAALADAEAMLRLAGLDAAFADATLLRRMLALPASASQRCVVQPIPTTPAAALFDDRLELAEARLHELEPLYLTGSYVDG